MVERARELAEAMAPTAVEVSAMASTRGSAATSIGPGAGVTMPIELRKGMAQYTTEAIRARAQGAITVECVVRPSGVCTNIRVVHAFNPTFGLDQEAIKAAAQWRFVRGCAAERQYPSWSRWRLRSPCAKEDRKDRNVLARPGA
jgi:TonB family protein